MSGTLTAAIASRIETEECGITGRIEDDAGGVTVARLVDPVDQLSLMVRLTEHDLEAVPLGRIAANLLPAPAIVVSP